MIILIAKNLNFNNVINNQYLLKSHRNYRNTNLEN
jgi:hypothetical protein